MLKLTDAPLRNGRVVARQVNGTTILLHPDTGQFYTLEAVGARIWDLCDGSCTVSRVVTVVGEEYDAPLETIRADVVELLTDLERERLVDFGL